MQTSHGGDGLSAHRPARRIARLIAGVAGAFALAGAGGAQATNGYFQHGYGTASKALAGAGAALSLDAVAPSVNPAGIAFLGNRVDFGLTAFNPERSVDVEGAPTQPANLLTPGKVESDRPWFPIPNGGITYRVDDRLALGLALYGNGGINTDYPAFGRTCPNPLGGPAVPGKGVFCGGEAGVDLTQVFLSPTAAYEFLDGWAVGVSPILAAQSFEAKGLGAFAPMSKDPASLSDNGHDMSYGAGVRLGIQGAVTDWLRVGASYRTRVEMSKFDDYDGLFAEDGDFDIPPSWTVGTALRPVEGLWILADFQQIQYDEVAAVSNEFPAGTQLGAENGPGFGWETMNVVKLGLQWRASEKLTLRAGYSTTDQPIPDDQLLFNILAPGVVEDHFTAGFGYRFSESWSVDASALYAPKVDVSGANATDPAQDVEVELSEFSATIGVTYRY
ncbi:OmpP1/FadL family transporter [Ferruginivarius sediminum]|uniref:OmpP1/FadL family transporter n=1 Tax=Ferruginivarius sediminum TaxID=2661937 RepID=UPI00137946FF|nr:outer membrane protein transport protein [Ferruginivarius sediminum]